ncbi:hypothetical protein N7468_007835 [Penicillium chermesinum]|uniref:Uncharacterized protein n=1 Tax=Penicillium chermesinum TaxID=63820 RepID=A0A9W9THW2_9EURO|nr:uncharacterized protein N7468_007835 [Penicillium chermesinum]KAJ5223293.1 hypothetical protein N7468_007835 [Penicillium chermesinum]
MHHQPNDIPWHLLASNLHWAPGELAPQIRALNLPQLPGKLKDKKGCTCGVTNLHPNSPAPQSPDQNEFARAFAQAVSDASKRKRAQYPEKYSPPSPSDILLGDELFEKVDSLLSQEIKGGPRLPFEQRTASAFLHPWECDDHCNWLSSTEIGFLNLEVVKLLLMLGEMGPILQACAHPDEGLSGWYSAAACDCKASPYDLGWDMALFNALEAYIVLNVALCFPQLYDPRAGRTDETDYRHTAFYQSMLRSVTESCDSEATSYPHQKFFGIPRDHFEELFDISGKIDQMHWLHGTDIIKRAGHYGLLSFDEFLNLEGSLDDQFQPSESDVESVKKALLFKGLPLEIVFMVMEFADYNAKRVLEVPHDPLHPANRAALDHYLDQCWQIIIGCNIMNDELDQKAPFTAMDR